MNAQAAAIVGISVLFLLLSVGTVTGLYHLEILGFSLAGLKSGTILGLTFLSVIGIAYGIVRWRK